MLRDLHARGRAAVHHQSQYDAFDFGLGHMGLFQAPRRRGIELSGGRIAGRGGGLAGQFVFSGRRSYRRGALRRCLRLALLRLCGRRVLGQRGQFLQELVQVGFSVDGFVGRGVHFASSPSTNLAPAA